MIDFDCFWCYHEPVINNRSKSGKEGMQKVLAEERFHEILQLVNERRAVTVQELTELLATSESTIRRDLTVLHNQGRLIKVHGGATALDASFAATDDSVAVREDLNREEKNRIARYAASLVTAEDFVFLDAGTTTGLMIDYLTEKRAVFVTDATVHAKRLAQKGFRVLVLGGEMKLSTEALVGAETVTALRRYNFTKGFFGTNGISLHHGFSTPDISEALVKEQAVRQCRERFVLSDASKFSKISPVTFARFSDAVVITTSLDDSRYQNCTNIFEVDKQQ